MKATRLLDFLLLHLLFRESKSIFLTYILLFITALSGSRAELLLCSRFGGDRGGGVTT